MKHHPDIDSAETNQEEFSRICEAYEVLSSGESDVLGAYTAVEHAMQQLVTWHTVVHCAESALGLPYQHEHTHEHVDCIFLQSGQHQQTNMPCRA
jgi:DnaJ-class molecular chaperone